MSSDSASASGPADRRLGLMNAGVPADDEMDEMPKSEILSVSSPTVMSYAMILGAGSRLKLRRPTVAFNPVA